LVLAICVALGLLLPRFLLPASAVIPFLVLGWDFTFKAYSICVDSAVARKSPTRASCMFFLLVDPSLVYATRAQPTTGQLNPGRSILRAGFGALAMLVGEGLRAVAEGLHVESSGYTGLSSLALVSASSAALFISIYALHSGLASIQIGSIKALGMHAIERYNYPLAARDLPDFWRRWNTYVGQWFLRYVFSPLSIRWGRRFQKGAMAKLARGAALVTTFAAVGLAHETGYFGRSGWPLQKVCLFTSMGVVVAAWNAMARYFQVSKSGNSVLRALVTGTLSRCVLATVVLTTAWRFV
jgi:hypothetical protein